MCGGHSAHDSAGMMYTLAAAGPLMAAGPETAGSLPLPGRVTGPEGQPRTSDMRPAGDPADGSASARSATVPACTAER